MATSLTIGSTWKDLELGRDYEVTWEIEFFEMGIEDGSIVRV